MSEPFGKLNRPPPGAPTQAKRRVQSRAPAPKPSSRLLLYVLVGAGLIFISAVALLI